MVWPIFVLSCLSVLGVDLGWGMEPTAISFRDPGRWDHYRHHQAQGRELAGIVLRSIPSEIWVNWGILMDD